jgi:hypothetical protein
VAFKLLLGSCGWAKNTLDLTAAPDDTGDAPAREYVVTRIEGGAIGAYGRGEESCP